MAQPSTVRAMLTHPCGMVVILGFEYREGVWSLSHSARPLNDTSTGRHVTASDQNRPVTATAQVRGGFVSCRVIDHSINEYVAKEFVLATCKVI